MLAVLASACGRSGAPEWNELDATPTPLPTASPFDDPFGDGRDGPLDVASGSTVVNDCRSVRASTVDSITLSAGDLAQPGDRLLVVQVQGGAPASSGDQTPVGLTQATGTGLWELAEVGSIAGTLVTLTAPLAHTYVSDPGRRAQACRVPQYTTVTVAADARLVASPWNGETGGIVALLANGTVTVEGEVSAVAAGFRGGAASLAGGGSGGLTDADTADEDGGEKGEGIDVSAWSLNGRGNVHSGAGGGNRRSAGGGGGGAGGAGGFGGFERGAEIDLTRGQGGARYDEVLTGRLLFGGGGGGGHREAGAASGANGGSGGGLVVVLAPAMAGSGALLADGADGDDAGSSSGGGGGGAGGTIVVWSNGTVALDAQGGSGGDADDEDAACGPGGGGGGGAVVVHTAGASADVDGGSAGQSTASNDEYGSTSGANGHATTF